MTCNENNKIIQKPKAEGWQMRKANDSGLAAGRVRFGSVCVLGCVNNLNYIFDVTRIYRPIINVA